MIRSLICAHVETCESEISVGIESRIESGGSRLHVHWLLSCRSCVCALATAVQLHLKWSCKYRLNYKRRKGWCFCWTVSERSLWYDGTRHVRLIRNFRIGTSLSNRPRWIGTSDSNSNRISKLRRSLVVKSSFSDESPSAPPRSTPVQSSDQSTSTRRDVASTTIRA